MANRFDRIFQPRKDKPEKQITAETKRKRKQFTSRELLILVSRLLKEGDYNTCVCTADRQCTGCLLKGARKYVLRKTPNPPIGWEIQHDDYTKRPFSQRNERLTLMRREGNEADHEVVCHGIIGSPRVSEEYGYSIDVSFRVVANSIAGDRRFRLREEDRLVVIRKKRR